MIRALALCLAFVCVNAERPRFFANPRFQRQEVELTTESADTSGDGPYYPSGWKPEGDQLALPARQSVPTDSYGVPVDNAPYPPSGWQPEGRAFDPATTPDPSTTLPPTVYGPPDDKYGPPSTTAETDTTVVDGASTTTAGPAQLRAADDVEVIKSEGKSYELLPNGELKPTD